MVYFSSINEKVGENFENVENWGYEKEYVPRKWGPCYEILCLRKYGLVKFYNVDLRVREYIQGDIGRKNGSVLSSVPRKIRFVQIQKNGGLFLWLI